MISNGSSWREDISARDVCVARRIGATSANEIPCGCRLGAGRGLITSGVSRWLGPIWMRRTGYPRCLLKNNAISGPKS